MIVRPNKKNHFLKKLLTGCHGNREKVTFWTNLLPRTGSKILLTIHYPDFKFTEMLHLRLRNGINHQNFRSDDLIPEYRHFQNGGNFSKQNMKIYYRNQTFFRIFEVHPIPLNEIKILSKFQINRTSGS